MEAQERNEQACPLWEREQEGWVQHILCRGGEVKITRYPVFPGITISYGDLHAAAWVPEESAAGDCLEISHCREGRMEYDRGEDCFFLAEGDLAVLHRTGSGGEIRFPTGHYHGITVTLDPSRAPDCLSCFLEGVDVRPQALMQRFCAGDGCFVARSSLRVAHIFSELYSVPEGIRQGYFKVKILELLLFLSVWEGEPRQSCSQSQVNLVRQVNAFWQTEPERRWTLPQLAARFGVSPSRLEGSFRSVYGMPPGACLRAWRMRRAAELLRSTDRSVLEIAGELGYDNGSKFAKAFRDVLGVSPSAYRRGEGRDSCAPAEQPGIQGMAESA